MKRPPKALTIGVFGARGTGKTAWIKQLIGGLGPQRLLVWDYKHDPDLKTLGKPITRLADLARAAAAPAFSLRYLVQQDTDPIPQFDLFCRIAWAAGNLTLFVDELPEVTKANKAPQAWRKCVNVGRSYSDGGTLKSLSIIGAGQRPTEVDKSFLGNCDVIHTGRLGYQNDAKALAQAWGTDFRELFTMPDLAWVEKRADNPQVLRGMLSFGNTKKPIAKKKQGLDTAA